MPTMSHDECTRLFNYMERRFNALEAKVDRRADSAQVESIIGTLDHVLKVLETHDQELLFIKLQLTRHEGWFKQLAGNTGTILDPEP